MAMLRKKLKIKNYFPSYPYSPSGSPVCLCRGTLAAVPAGGKPPAGLPYHRNWLTYSLLPTP
ncbi:MAG: hypothetical protein HC908_16145 [Calothrix sp. SM1_7_51]|nr:hypothetical protein [Calothrix sp. SM1_7_51]